MNTHIISGGQEDTEEEDDQTTPGKDLENETWSAVQVELEQYRGDSTTELDGDKWAMLEWNGKVK